MPFSFSLVYPNVAPIDLSTLKTQPYNPIQNGSDDPLQRHGHLKFSKMAADHHLKFGQTGDKAVQSANLKNPTPVYRKTHCRVMAI